MSTSPSSRNSLIGQYPFLLLLAALSCGIISQDKLESIQATHWLLLTGCSGLIASGLHIFRSARYRLSLIRICSLATSFFLLGAALSSLQDTRNCNSWYGHYLNCSEALVLKVEEAPQEKERTVSIPASVKHIRVAGRWLPVQGKIQLYIYRKANMPRYGPGQILLIPAKLIPVKNSGNPFAFDYAGYAARQGLYHQSFLPPEEVRLIKEERTSEKLLSSFRKTLQESITLSIKDSITRSLIEATILNERASLDEALWKAYSVTGIVHIIAISGMHITLLAGFILLLLRILPFKKLDWLKYTLAIMAIWCYIALTGFPPSAVRAGVMFTLMAIGLIGDRVSNPLNLWAAAGFLLLSYNPNWIYDIGVQLSFLAVLSILLFYVPIRKWYTPPNRLLSMLWEIMAVSIAAQVLVAPLVIYYFHQFPVLGLAANMPAAIFSVLLMYGSVMLFLFHLAGVPCLWLGQLLTWLTHGFHIIITFLADATPGLMRQLYIDGYEYWLMMVSVTCLCLFFIRKRVLFLYAGLITAFALLADLIIKDTIAVQQERLVVYNVSRTSLADVFRGKTVTPVYPRQEALPDKTVQYTLLPARLAFRAIREQKHPPQDLYRIGNATILFLDRCAAIQNGQSFPVDFLVISRNCVFDPERWYTTFHPRKIIIDGSLPRWKAIQWKQRLEALGAPVHWVQEDGAWIFPALSS